MRISIVTDEISQDFRSAVELGCEWGLTNFEVRTVEFNRVPNISQDTLKRVLDVVKEYWINITAVSPGVFCDTTPLSPEAKEETERVLPKTFELAHKLDTDKVIIFGFNKPRDTKERSHPPEIVEALRHAAERAEKEGLTLALENEPTCWADTGENTARIVEAVGSKALRVNWDPANALNAGDTPFPLGYGYVKDYVANVHVKDVRLDPSTGKWRCIEVGEGDVDWRGQLKALEADGYRGCCAVETHFGPRIRRSRDCLNSLRRILRELRIKHD